MAGSRTFGGKFAVAAVLSLGMGTWSAVQGRDLNPSVWRLAAQPERWAGRVLWIPAVRVAECDTDGFWVEGERARLRVRGRAEVRPGDEVSLKGRMNPAGPHLELLRARVLPPWARLRGAVEAVSLAVLGWVFLNLRKHFSFHPEVLQAKGRGWRTS